MKELRKNISAKIFAAVMIVLLGGIFIASSFLTVIQMDSGLYMADKPSKMEYQQNIYDKAADYIAYEIGYDLVLDEVKINEKIGYEITAIHDKKVLAKSNLDIKKGNYVAGKAYPGYDGKQYEANVYFKDINDCGVEHIHMMAKVLDYGYETLYTAPIIAVISAILLILLVAFWVYAAGMAKEGVKSSFVEKIPFDLLTGICFAVALVVSVFAVELIDNTLGFNIWFLASLLVCGYLLLAAMGLMYLKTLAVRVKQKNLIKNTIIYKVLVVCRKILKKLIDKVAEFVRGIPFIWKYAVIIIGGAMALILAINIFMYMNAGVAIILSLVIAAGMILLLKAIMDLNKVKNAANKLASGDILYKMDTKNMKGDMKILAEDFNKISDGMSKAVEERLQSERFKTELITNVSHDIKTPLTSIINYTDLLSKVDIDNEDAKSYIDVLNRQSLRLKKLIEDLIEASKAATGAIKIEKNPCNIETLIRQTVGEYEEKLKNSGLSIITNINEDNVMIMADGRRLWRVFENLLNNICKYSQANTRVYVDLINEEDKVKIVFKNTSSYPLNMSGDELIKRFVRGDKSRTTEGSGLGLSIAKNLVELQDGLFNIKIDGDLFKAIIEFDKIK